MAFGNIFGIGGGTFISRLIGEGNIEKTKNVSSFCFYGSILVGALLMAVFLTGMATLLRLIGCSENTEGFTRSYLTWVSYGGVIIVLAHALTNIVRAEGAAKQSMTGMMIGTIVNIILDPIMIIMLGWGVVGAAVATVIGNTCTVLYFIYYFLHKNFKSLLSISIRDFKYTDNILTKVLAIGIPASLANILMSVSNIFLNLYLKDYGESAVAAMGIAMKAGMLVMVLQMGFAMGVQPLVGYNYGAKKFERMNKTIRFSCICTCILGSALTITYLIFSEQIVKMFINNAEVISYGVPMLRAIMTAGPFIGILFTFNYTIQAMGKATISLILSLSRQGLFFFPIVIIGDWLFGLNGIIYAQPLADIGSLIMAVIVFAFISRKMKTEVKDEVNYPAPRDGASV